MLKIKDNVELKQLERFGFIKCKATGGYIYFYDIYKNYGLYIEIEVMQDRTIWRRQCQIARLYCINKSKLVQEEAMYEFFSRIEKLPTKKEKLEALEALTEWEMKLLKHSYLNKNMPSADVFRKYVNRGIAPSKVKCPTLESVIDYAEQEYDIELLMNSILYVIDEIDLEYGWHESRATAKILLCQKRILGITAKDVQQELDRRYVLRK